MSRSGVASLPAAEPPRDNNRITSLSAEQARSIVAARPGVPVTIEVVGHPHVSPEALSLNGLESIDVETSRSLAAYRTLALTPDTGHTRPSRGSLVGVTTESIQ